jgi:uracil-DNA glycosylase family 4
MIAEIIPFRNTVQCTDCALHATLNGGCQLLLGSGPHDARFMFVGEAPGYQESREGRPFVGESGQLLNKLIAKAGLRRENVFVTNGVRCQPPVINKKQQKPKKPSIVACRSHLKREIELVKPDLIFALGNVPLESLTGSSGITKLRGSMTQTSKKFFGVEIPVMPTFHPAYALREPAHEKDIVFDILTGLRSIDGGFNVVDTDFKLYQTFGSPDPSAPFWSWDIETNARELDDPDLCVWMISIDDGTNIVMFQSLYVQDAVDIMERYLKAGGQLVGQNASAFDRMVIKKLYGTNLRTHDTQLLWHLLDEEAATNLQSQAIRTIGVAPWKDGFDKDFWWNWASKTDDEKYESMVYNARDTRYTRMIFEEYRKQVPPRIWNLYVRHNLPVSRALAEVERHGVYLSQENIEESAAEIEVEQRVALLHLQDLTRPDFNPGSHQQVRELLFSDLMLPVQKTTDGGDPSTDAEVLKRLQSMNLGGAVIDTVWKYRKSSKLLQFLRTYKEARPAHGWARPSYSMTTTVNYRTSSFGVFNPQQTPRDRRVRKAIAAPPGWKLIEADYKMLELYVAAELAGPQSALYQALLRGEDVHTIMAARLTGKPLSAITKAERSDAKPANFAFLYYADEPTYIRQSLVDFDRIVPFEEGTRAKQAFRAWGVDPWWDQVFEELEEYGEVQSIFGAVRRLPAIRSRDKYNQLEAKREALNFTDASVACHIAELAMADAIGRGERVGAFIHDALLAYAPEDDAERCAASLQYSMETNVPALIEELFGYRFSLPLKAEVTIGDYWGDKA